MRTVSIKSRAFTIAEIIVAMTVSLLLGLTVLNIFITSQRAISGSMSRVEMVRQTRIPVNRVLSYLSSAVAIPGVDPVFYPEVDSNALAVIPNERGQRVAQDDPSSWHRLVVFRTTEDFFATSAGMGYDFDPNSIMDVEDIKNNIQAWERDQQRLSDYVIWFEDDAAGLNLLPNDDKVVAIGRLRDNTGSVPRDANWVRSWAASGGSSSILHPSVDVRFLGRGLEDVTFRRREANGVQVSVLTRQRVKHASGQMQIKEYRADAVIQIPTETLN